MFGNYHVLLHKEMEKLLLYSPHIGPRLKYIATQMVAGIMGMELNFTSDLNEALTTSVPLINYSEHEIAGSATIIPYGLLDETGIRDHKIDIYKRDGTPVFFVAKNGKDPGFDLFSSSFYMLSRYEEYLPFTADQYGRFPFIESMACKHSLVEEPLVELWTSKLKECLLEKYPGLKFPERKFSYIPTIDIDIPWAYLNRNFFRTAGGFARSLLKFEIDDLISRYRVLFCGQKDHYDTFEMIDKIHSEYGFSACFFFSAGTYGKFDKSVPLIHPQYSRLICSLAQSNKWGIHPSYSSYDDPALFRREIKELAAITGHQPFRSRQHFLRLGFPGTYRLLINNGIKEDYTLGWPEMPGFRAGTSIPFKYYDIEKEEETLLTIYPLHIMDGSLKDYLKLQPDEAAVHACRVINRIKDVGGTLITLWHNESFSERGRWENWKHVYLEIAKSVIS